MKLRTAPYKGTRDFYPSDKRLQKYIFSKLREVVESFGYIEYDAPILEPLDIFLAKSGEEIINDQVYSFTDRGGRKIAIRPEMTPSVSRMVAARRQELAYPLRLYSIPNLWRYERPQRGRLREHWQLNVDIFGVGGLAADHEIIQVASTIMRSFKAPADSYVIRISSRKLLEYFLHKVLGLSGRGSLDAQRLVDKKHKVTKAKFTAEAKSILKDTNQVAHLLEFLNANSIRSLPSSVSNHPSVSQLDRLFNLLQESGVTEAVFDTSIVRGMEYYTDIVFEVFDTNRANLRSLFGGGRYDGLVGLFGVSPLPTVGFGMGDVTLQNFLETHSLLPQLTPETDATVILIGDVYRACQKVLPNLRTSGLRLSVDSSGRKLDSQIKSAVKSGVRYAIFIGETELTTGTFKLRDLLQEKEVKVNQAELISALKENRKK